MIENFEDITFDLTEGEQKLVPMFVKGLSLRVGKEKIISSTQMQQGIFKTHGIVVPGSRIRKIVHHIRNNFLIHGLMATSKGYYVSNDPKEIESYIRSLDQREARIRTTKNNMELYLMKLLNK